MNTNSNSHESKMTPSTESSEANIRSGNGAVHGEFYNFVHEIEGLVKATMSLSGEDLTRAREKLSARVLVAKNSLEKMGGIITERARNTANTTNRYVHAHPWQSLGMGAVCGLLIGLVIARHKNA